MDDGRVVEFLLRSVPERKGKKAAGACEWTLVVMQHCMQAVKPKQGGTGSGKEIKRDPR